MRAARILQVRGVKMPGMPAGAALALIGLLAAGAAPAQAPPPEVTLQPPGGPGDPALVNPPAGDPPLDAAALRELVRQNVRYVFVIFNENHSFDNEFGTFPGVNGIYSDGTSVRVPASFTQIYADVHGDLVTVQPFRIGPEQNANAVDSVDHSHAGLARKIDAVDGIARMDGFARDEYARFAPPGAPPAQAAKATQFARLVMSHIDCDTIPFFWRWASNFTIFDAMFATEDTPSTPNAIAMIAGQSGETQWVRHPNRDGPAAATGMTGPMAGSFVQFGATVQFSGTGTTNGPPIIGDPEPYFGSQFDATVPTDAVRRQPYGPNDSYAAGNIASNLTFATLPLTLLGRDVDAAMRADLDPGLDTADIRQDIDYIGRLDRPPVAWRWYENGYGPESSDHEGAATHAAFVSHHEGPQYFGYIANNPSEYANLRSESRFFADLAADALPPAGVFYVRGGYLNQMGLAPYTHPGTPPAEAAAIRAAKSGDDDHPAYSDRQLSEAMAARVINAIAEKPALWSQSAIIIAYDESDGFYDHVAPRILAYGPDGLPLARGIRVPLILISPYARSHAVSHVEGDHNAVIETINAIFDLPPLASLPDENQALADGDSPYFNQFGPPGFHQRSLGPRDIESPISNSLLSGFDPLRLSGRSPPLPPTLAQIPAAELSALPHYGGRGCSALNLRPLAPQSDSVPPPGFNPLPSTYPAAN